MNVADVFVTCFTNTWRGLCYKLYLPMRKYRVLAVFFVKSHPPMEQYAGTSRFYIL